MKHVAHHHADWHSLIDISGPFVSLPVLLRAFPHELEARDAVQAKLLREQYEAWRAQADAPGRQHAWLCHVLQQLLGYPALLLAQNQSLPPALCAKLPEMGETLRPEWALLAPAQHGYLPAGQAQLLIQSYPPGQPLDKPVPGKHWRASPATRMMELLHASDVALGLISNGEQWMLVYAPRGQATGYASWYSQLWFDEPITLRAFHSLMGTRRLFNVTQEATLLALLNDSANDQQDVTDQLGQQVREAVAVLVHSFDALDSPNTRQLLQAVVPAQQYEAALAVMMRLVFLFSAEERGLLHLGEALYDDNYAVSTLQEQLQEVADRHGEEILERRCDAWVRLLATFRAVHGGIQHQDLAMPAYGGSLFDPERYPFLEGRSAGSAWRHSQAQPLAVNNRVVLHLLNSLQRLRAKQGAQQGTQKETRRVSFRTLGVEQIGHVYEGLLDHTAVRASDVVLGLKGANGKDAELALAQLETLAEQGSDALVAFLQQETGRAAASLRKDLAATSVPDAHKLLLACAQERALLARVYPYAKLLRLDSFDKPMVVLAGRVYVTSGTARRSSGTHYTPPSLTEPIVRHTLEPLVYHGPAQGVAHAQWQLKTASEILALRVCDMAMGSGAFLVQTCRYLAERLCEAWAHEEQSGQLLVTPLATPSQGHASERLLPQDAKERYAIACRAIADRCLYGVDINPMAVEMAKLSLWLITVDATRPFTFLDHAFKCGDSLLGITDKKQLEDFTLRPEGVPQTAFETGNLWRHVEEAQNKREKLEDMPSDTPEQLQLKMALYQQAEEAVAKLNAAADVLLALELKGLRGKTYISTRQMLAEKMMAYWTQGLQPLQAYAREQLGARRSFHWALAYPEIIAKGGFDAFVGNPPFIGEQKITGLMGTDYRDYLLANLAGGKKGSADLCAYFFLRVGHLLKRGGMAGLLATNTIAQGDTREVGLEQLLARDICIARAIPSTPWPGVAALEVAHVWLRRGDWLGTCKLDEQQVTSISAMLTKPGSVAGTPYRLRANEKKSF